MTIFGAPVYSPKYAYMAYLAIFGHIWHIFGRVFERAKYGQVGCPRKRLSKYRHKTQTKVYFVMMKFELRSQEGKIKFFLDIAYYWCIKYIFPFVQISSN